MKQTKRSFFERMNYLDNAYKVGIVINVAFLVAELIAGFVLNSVALFSDVWHNVSDVFALFFSMVAGVIAYIAGSWITYKEPYNLDRLFHRGIYSDDPEEVEAPKKKMSVGTWIYTQLIGITSEYTRGDKVIAWSVFIYSLVYSFGIMFCGVLVWNLFFPFSTDAWAVYFFITIIGVALVVGAVSTVWFLIGGLIDMRALFRDLEARIANPLDDGRVEGHVSVADKARFDALESMQREKEAEAAAKAAGESSEK